MPITTACNTRECIPASVARFCAFFSLVLALSFSWKEARADLMLTPTRVVLEKNQRAAQVDLINNSSETMVYRLKLVNRRMSETGELSLADTPEAGEQFADGLLRYSPRQVVLAPGASQVVRIMARKPADLAPGEYRSHLLFERVADSAPAPAEPLSKPMPEAEGIEIKLTPLIGVSIPVIVRHGQTSAAATFAGLKLERPDGNGPALLSFELHRSGNRSIYGDLLVRFTPDQGREQQAARVNGIAVYTPNPLRRGKIELAPPFDAAKTGTLRLVYRERAELGGKLLAEASLRVP